jgi:hypothetical protein
MKRRKKENGKKKGFRIGLSANLRMSDRAIRGQEGKLTKAQLLSVETKQRQ